MPDHAANTVSQSAALAILREQLPGFYVPTKTEKKKLLELMGISKRFAQTFDAIRMRVADFSDIQSAKDFDLLELKAEVRAEFSPDCPLLNEKKTSV